ncbi:hypothetical protein [Bosea sp. 2RAB26]|uniref:hypothetical protein n=1 Tax=Bosea sp. 2RAB26 TaxID=3237476 RepID=UPI003F92C362
MHPKEVELFESFLSETTNYFEFGTGGSTCLAAKIVKGAIYGVDTDRAWIEKVLSETSGRANINLRHIDVGRTLDWGTPASAEAAHLFSNYSRAIVDSGRSDFDLCLVDGRFRVACFLQALGHLPRGAVVGIHDYAARPEYHLIEEFARPISSAHQLKFFVRRRDCDHDKLKSVMEAHRTIWA